MVDTNILFSFFRENPVRFIIINSSFFGLELCTPEYAIEELWNNRVSLCKYARLKTEMELQTILSALKSYVEVKPMEFFEDYKEIGKSASPDKKDAPFFALALKLNAGIWSNEPRLKQQSVLPVFSTQEVMKELLRKI